MKDDLVKRLQDPPFGTETSERNLMAQAAARIAELEMQVRTLRLQCDAASQGWAAETVRAETAETQVAKLTEALEEIASHDTGATAGIAYTARAALLTIKQEKNDG